MTDFTDRLDEIAARAPLYEETAKHQAAMEHAASDAAWLYRQLLDCVGVVEALKRRRLRAHDAARPLVERVGVAVDGWVDSEHQDPVDVSATLTAEQWYDLICALEVEG